MKISFQIAPYGDEAINVDMFPYVQCFWEYHYLLFKCFVFMQCNKDYIFYVAICVAWFLVAINSLIQSKDAL